MTDLMRATHLQSNMEVNNGSNSNGNCGALFSLCMKGGGSLPIKDSSVMFYRSMREEFILSPPPLSTGGRRSSAAPAKHLCFSLSSPTPRRQQQKGHSLNMVPYLYIVMGGKPILSLNITNKKRAAKLLNTHFGCSYGADLY